MAVVTIDAAAQVAASSGATGWSARGTFVVPDLDVCQLVTSAVGTAVGSVAGQTRVGQSFTTTSAFSLAAVRLLVAKVLAPADNFSVEIYANASNLPTGAPLATSDVIAGADISTSIVWREFVFPSPPSLASGTKYWIVCKRSGALDASNYLQWRHSTASSYASNGRSLDNAGAWGAESGTIDMAFETVKTTASLYQITQDTGGSPEFHMYKSTDNAASWSEVDVGNGPSVFNTAYPWSADWAKSGLNNAGEGNAIVLARFTNTNTVRMTPFNIGAQTWGADLGAADASTDAVNTRSIRAAITPIEQGIFYTSLADDADVARTRRTTSTWTAGAWFALTSANGSTLSDVVKDNTVYGSGSRFITGFVYDVSADDYSIQTLTTATVGALTDVDATAAVGNTKHASATYGVYDPGTDTVIAAYIDSDDTLEERTAQLEVTSASVTFGTQHGIGTSTSYAGRQLSTCKFGSDLYVFASTGTGIDYYKDTGASGTWGSVNNWKSGLTNCFLSQATPVTGVGIIVVYNDNGDVKVDIAEPAVSDINVNGTTATATATATAGSISIPRNIAGTTATATGSANTGSIPSSPPGTTATATGAANTGTFTRNIPGVTAAATGTANAGSLTYAASPAGTTAAATGSANVGTRSWAITGATTSATATANAGTPDTGTVPVTVNGTTAAATGAASAGSFLRDIPGTTSTATATANAGSITAPANPAGTTATATGSANAGTFARSIPGTTTTATGTANAGSVTYAASPSGTTATATATANAGTARVDRNIAGTTASATGTANSGTLTYGANVTGATATSTATANVGTARVDRNIAGTTAAATAAANAGSLTYGANVTGTTATATATANVGNVIAGGSVTINGTTATATAAANAGSLSYAANATGTRATVTAAANTGTIQTATNVAGTTASVTVTATQGSLSIPRNVAGTTATVTGNTAASVVSVATTGTTASVTANAYDSSIPTIVDGSTAAVTVTGNVGAARIFPPGHNYDAGATGTVFDSDPIPGVFVADPFTRTFAADPQTTTFDASTRELVLAAGETT